MTKKKHTPVNTEEHAPKLLAIAHYYAKAAARYRITRQRPGPRHITRTRFLEASTYFDTQLTALVLRTGPKGRTLITATDAARIKAAAHHLADLLTEGGTTPDLCPQSAHRNLAQLIYATLHKREAEDTPNQKPNTRDDHTVTHPQALAA